MSQNIFDTKMKILILDQWDLRKKYKEIGVGTEGNVFNYQDRYALKKFSLFLAMKYCYEEKLERRFAKLEKMSLLKDENFCFPIGIFGYQDLEKVGCYSELVKYEKGRKDFTCLWNLNDTKEVFRYLIEADAAMHRFHKMGGIIGDIKEDNIMIDKNGHPKFIDTDNFAYQEYDFEFTPDRISCLKNRYNKEFSLKDNDIFVFSMMALYILTRIEGKWSNEDILQIIHQLDTAKEVKNGLKNIFSDSQNKPYIGSILQEIKNPQRAFILKR